jgi:hypothetical protein
MAEAINYANGNPASPNRPATPPRFNDQVQGTVTSRAGGSGIGYDGAGGR